MTQHIRHHTINRLKKKYRHLVAAVAGAVMLSGAALPVSQTIAHAASAPKHEKRSPAPSQPVGNTKAAALTKAKHRGNSPTKYEQVLTVQATAYAPGAHDNGKWGNKTFLGTNVRPGIIAVDPRIIPLGSRVYIEYPDGRGEYAVAEDTGGAIKGNRIDIAKWTVKEATDFGIQQVKVYVLG